MKIFKEIFGRIWALWGMLLFLSTMLIAFIFFLPCAFLGEPRRTIWFQKVSRIWMIVFLNLIGCPLKIHNKERFEKEKNYVVVCNHNSLMDVPVTTPFLPHANKTIAKSSFAKVPIFGWIYSWGSILVDRENTRSRVKSFSAMMKVLNEWHLDMVLYPEGTRNKTDQPLKTFFDGAFKLSIDTQKDLMPIVLLNSRKVLPAAKPFYLLPHRLELYILEPFSPIGESAKTLKEKVYSAMWNCIEDKSKQAKP